MAYLVKENEALAGHTVFRIGGPARFFVEVGNSEELASALKSATSLGVPWIIIAAGSNVLVSDQGYNGMAIHWLGGAVEIRGEEVVAEAPVPMARVVSESLKAGLRGFEWGIGIPGTIGGSVRGNAGCFGGEMKDVVESVKVFNTASGEVGTWPAPRLEFGYRHSIFKSRPELVVTAAVLKLKRGDPREGEALLKEYSLRRSKTQDIGSKCAGCIFKNVLWNQPGIDAEKLIKRFPELGQFKNSTAISAGFLIDRVGLKGKTVGGAKISDRHGNFFVNMGQATAKDVATLIGIAKECVGRRYGLTLEEEIQRLGF